jgi:hypothetical protein
MLGKIGDFNDNFEVDPETHWIKAFRDDGEFYLIEPRAAIQLSVWSRQRRMDLIQAQERLDEEAKAHPDQE